jgi:hypothetical protein
MSEYRRWLLSLAVTAIAVSGCGGSDGSSGGGSDAGMGGSGGSMGGSGGSMGGSGGSMGGSGGSVGGMGGSVGGSGGSMGGMGGSVGGSGGSMGGMGGAVGGSGGTGGVQPSPCEAACAKLADCTATEEPVDLCPGLSADTRDAFIQDCVPTCDANPPLLAIVQGQNDCATLVTTLKGVSADFRDACEGMGGMGGAGGAGGAGGTGGAGGIGGSGGAGGIGGAGGVGGTGGAGGIGGAGGAGGIGGSGGVGGGGGAGGAGMPSQSCASAIDFNAQAQAGADGALSLAGQTPDAGEQQSLDCGDSAEGPEVVYHFAAPAAGLWAFTTVQPGVDPDTLFDTVLYARGACDDAASELACNDDAEFGVHQSRLTLRLDQGQGIFLFVDTYTGTDGGAFVLTASPVPVVGEGGDCDPTESANVCAEGTTCLTQDFGDTYTCVAATAPVITHAEAFLSPEFGTAGFRVEGTDAENNVSGMLLQVFDAQGNEIPLTAFGGPIQIGFDTLEQANGQFVGTVRYPGLPAGAATAMIGAFDDTDLWSDLAEIEFAAPPVVGEEQACDPQRGLNACDNGLYCHQDAPNTYSCAAAEPACPDAWDVASINDGAVEGGWEVSGNTSDSAVFARSTCGGGGGAVVYTFTADAAGDYLFDVTSDDEGADTVLYLRSLCDFEDVAAEVACNDNAGGGLGTSELVAHLDQGQTVYVFVDGQSDGETSWTGPFTLDVSPVQAECPADWTITDLNQNQSADGWSVDGDLTRDGLEDHGPGAAGTCGGTGANDVYSFTAPAAGSYTFETTGGAGGDTVLFVRSLCGVPGGGGELACNDDKRGGGDDGFYSRVTTQLEADQTVYVFVDTFGPHGRSPYTLNVTAAP